MAVVAVIALAACNSGGSVTGVVGTDGASERPVHTPAAEQPRALVEPVAQLASPQVECYVGDGGSFYVRTKGGSARQYAASITGFDNQDPLVAGVAVGVLVGQFANDRGWI
jgi:hypothetical protein